MGLKFRCETSLVFTLLVGLFESKDCVGTAIAAGPPRFLKLHPEKFTKLSALAKGKSTWHEFLPSGEFLETPQTQT